jgi:NitT/TauT family transport system substrate-binding protein
MEKNAAAQAGELDGHFCEIGAVIIQRSMDIPFIVVATSSHTNTNRRNFGLVTRPGSPYKTIEELKGKSLAITKLYIVDFLTDMILEKLQLPFDYFERTDIIKIPVRYQMLINGQLEAALFPEPLLTMAEREGSKVLVDDTILDMPLAVIALRSDLSDQIINSFREALADAVTYINQNPKAARAFMAELRMIPPALGDDYELPEFNPELIPDRLPSLDLFEAYVSWLIRNQALAPAGSNASGKLRPAPAFEDVVWQPKS